MRGFTIPELMIVVAVVGVLLVVGIPQMGKLVEGRQLVGQATELASALAFTRAEAVARANNVGMCASNNRTDCSGAWNDGWIIFLDADNSGGWTGGDAVLKSEGAMNGDVSLISASSTIVFNLSGESTAAGNVVFNLCSANPDKAIGDANKSRLVTVNKVGSANISMGNAACP